VYLWLLRFRNCLSQSFYNILLHVPLTISGMNEIRGGGSRLLRRSHGSVERDSVKWGGAIWLRKGLGRPDSRSKGGGCCLRALLLNHIAPPHWLAPYCTLPYSHGKTCIYQSCSPSKIGMGFKQIWFSFVLINYCYSTKRCSYESWWMENETDFPCIISLLSMKVAALSLLCTSWLLFRWAIPVAHHFFIGYLLHWYVESFDHRSNLEDLCSAVTPRNIFHAGNFINFISNCVTWLWCHRISFTLVL
jgi:hypothetical protein